MLSSLASQTTVDATRAFFYGQSSALKRFNAALSTHGPRRSDGPWWVVGDEVRPPPTTAVRHLRSLGFVSVRHLREYCPVAVNSPRSLAPMTVRSTRKTNDDLRKRAESLCLSLHCHRTERSHLATDLRRPWEKPAPPHKLTPARVRRGFPNLRTTTGSPAGAPKPTTPGPGRPPGSKNRRPATRHDVGRVLAGGEAYQRPAHHKVGSRPRRAG